MAGFQSEMLKDMSFRYMIGGSWYHEKEVCHYCLEAQEEEPRLAEDRYSFGIYAGKYCDICWPKSGYRDATDPEAKFDPADAGEVLEPEDY